MNSLFTFMYLASFTTAVVFVTVLAMGVPPRPEKRPLFVVGVLIGMWSLGDLLSNVAHSAAEVEALAMIFAPLWAATPPCMVRAALIFAGHVRFARSAMGLVTLFAPTLLVVWVVWSGRLYGGFIPSTVNGWYFRSLTTSWQHLVNAYLLTYVLCIVGLVVVAARRKGSILGSHSVRVLAFGLIPVTLIGTFVNGLLPATGVHPPFIASVLLTVMGAIGTSGMLKRTFMGPLDAARRERDLLETSLQRREQVLAALPMGVAIVGRDDLQIVYANPPFDQLVDAVEADDARLPAAILAALEAAQDHRLDWVMSPEHRPDTTLHVNSCPVRYDQADAILVTLRDITAQTKAESDLASKNRQLLQAHKLEAIGRLAAGVAHDFNNQIQGILLCVDYLGIKLDKNHEAHKEIGEIAEAAGRSAALVRQLLTFAKRQKVQPQVVDVNEVLGKLETMITRLLGSTIIVTIEPAPRPATVFMDRVQLEQVLVTLASNARDAMPSCGRLWYCVEVANGKAEGARVEIRVTDTGVGMAPEVAEHIFEPFFTTKGKNGTGLGLATTYGIVAGAGGAIAVTSTPGEGSTFTVSLPAHCA